MAERQPARQGELEGVVKKLRAQLRAAKKQGGKGLDEGGVGGSAGPAGRAPAGRGAGRRGTRRDSGGGTRGRGLTVEAERLDGEHARSDAGGPARRRQQREQLARDRQRALARADGAEAECERGRRRERALFKVVEGLCELHATP